MSFNSSTFFFLVFGIQLRGDPRLRGVQPVDVGEDADPDEEEGGGGGHGGEGHAIPSSSSSLLPPEPGDGPGRQEGRAQLHGEGGPHEAVAQVASCTYIVVVHVLHTQPILASLWAHPLSVATLAVVSDVGRHSGLL